jgi:hypothetical protein
VATSGSVTFAPTLVDIFEEAFERATGDELRHGYQVRSLRRSLNLLLLDWQNRGYNLWQLANATTYVLTGDSTAPLAADCVDTIEVLVSAPTEQTTLVTALPDGVTTTVVVAAAFTPTTAFSLRIEDETVLVTAGFGTTTLTVTRGYSGTAVAHATAVPVFIAAPGESEIALARQSVPDYAAIPNKTTSGRPSTMLVRREAAPVTLTLWPVPERVYALSYWYLRRAQDAGNGVNEPDIPIRFVPAMIAGLAFYIGQKTPKAAANLAVLEAQYVTALASAQSEDREKAPLRMVPRGGIRR